jgi:hypothetical protein
MTMGNSFLEPSESLSSTHSIRPKAEDQLDLEIMEQLEQMGFEPTAAKNAVLGAKFNQAAGTYYLLAAQKRSDAAKYAKESAARMQQRHESNDESESGHQRKSVSTRDSEVKRHRRGSDSKKKEKRASIIENAANAFPVAAGLVPLHPTQKGGRKSQLDIIDALAQQQAAVLVPVGAEDAPKNESEDALNMGFLSPNRVASPSAASKERRNVRRLQLEEKLQQTLASSNTAPPSSPQPSTLGPPSPTQPRSNSTVKSNTNEPNRLQPKKSSNPFSQTPVLPPIAGASNEPSLQKSTNLTTAMIDLSNVSKSTTHSRTNMVSRAASICEGAHDVSGVGHHSKKPNVLRDKSNPGLTSSIAYAGSNARISVASPPISNHPSSNHLHQPQNHQQLNPHSHNNLAAQNQTTTSSGGGGGSSNNSAGSNVASKSRKRSTINEKGGNQTGPDLSLYMDPAQDIDPSTMQPISDYPEYGSIRIIRYGFNLSGTTSGGQAPDILMELLTRVLTSHQVSWRLDPNGCPYQVECDSGEVKFEIEICKVPKVRGVYGVRMKRLNGDTWDFKRLSGKILADLNL